MKVIALRGGENSGKSHTINIVYSFLIKDGYTQVPGHFRIDGNPIFQDVNDILIKGTKKVGIIGMGDYLRAPNGISYLISDLESKGCNVVVCACRNTSKIVESVLRKFPAVIWIDKTISTGEFENRIVNARDAERIFGNV